MLNEKLSTHTCPRWMGDVCGDGLLFQDWLASTHPALHTTDRQCFLYRNASAGLYGGIINRGYYTVAWRYEFYFLVVKDNILLTRASGSYDHWLKAWDLRSQGSILSMDHGAPVECVQIFPTGGICISAGKKLKITRERR